MRRSEKLGMVVMLLGAAVSVMALVIACIDTYFGIDFGLADTSVWGVPGVNGWMQFMLLIGAAMLLIGVIPSGKAGLRFIILEAQLTVSGILFFTLPVEFIYPARFVVLAATFLALWQFGLLVGPIVKIGSIGTELLGWGKALNSFSGLAAGGDLLFISSYLNYKRHGNRLDLIWTWLNLPFAVFAHLDLAAEMAATMGWGEVLHLHVAGFFVLGASWFMVLHFRTRADLDGPHKPKPADELLPRFDLHWKWKPEASEWVAVGACGTEYVTGCIQSGMPSGTEWELDGDLLERRKRRLALLQQKESGYPLNPAEQDEFSKLDREILPTIMRIEARWAELGALDKKDHPRIQQEHLDRRHKLREALEEKKSNPHKLDPLGWTIERLLPAT